eukprot:scaffold118437_cov19-Tisochrysis_lutea.AAC.1
MQQRVGKAYNWAGTHHKSMLSAQAAYFGKVCKKPQGQSLVIVHQRPADQPSEFGAWILSLDTLNKHPARSLLQ